MTEQPRGAGGRVLVVGSANVDLTATVTALPGPGQTVIGYDLSRRTGGKGANQAAAAGRLGADVWLVAAVGSDDSGTAVRDELVAAGVRVDRLHLVDDTATGTALITVDRAGENTIVVVPGANQRLGAEQVSAGLRDAKPADVVVVSLEIEPAVAAAALRQARRQGAATVLNPSPFTPAAAELLSDVDVLILNEGEAAALGQAALDRSQAAVIVTLGGAGARLRPAPGTKTPAAADGGWYARSAPEVDVVDTTGCGDAFAGALAAELASGHSLVDAMGVAVDYAALAATAPGAQNSYVDLATFRATFRASSPAQYSGQLPGSGDPVGPTAGRT